MNEKKQVKRKNIGRNIWHKITTIPRKNTRRLYDSNRAMMVITGCGSIDASARGSYENTSCMMFGKHYKHENL